jgi:hypothetical protein
MCQVLFQEVLGTPQTVSGDGYDFRECAFGFRKHRNRCPANASDPIDARSEVARLESLDQLDYERQCVVAAKTLHMRVSTLDKLVTKKRDVNGRKAAVANVESWPDPVDGALLHAVSLQNECRIDSGSSSSTP